MEAGSAKLSEVLAGSCSAQSVQTLTRRAKVRRGGQSQFSNNDKNVFSPVSVLSLGR